MPYIQKGLRRTAALDPNTAGELNYAITSLVLDYVDGHGGPSYSLYNEIIGALEAAKLEFYRRAVAPYEDIKMRENGDVY